MAPFTTAFLFTLLALPLNVFPLTADCTPKNPSYKTNTQGVVDGHVYLSSVSCLAGSNGCSLSLSELRSYSISVTIAAGINLGVDPGDAEKAGLTAGVSWSDSKLTVNTGGANCPAGGWTCGLAITPSVYQVTGHIAWEYPCRTVTKDGDYTIQYPMTDKDGKPLIKAWACACPDHRGWANAHAPPKCPSNCDEAA